MLYDGETFYYENYFYDLQTHEKSISKIVFNSSSVTTGTNLFEMNNISFISRIYTFGFKCTSSIRYKSVTTHYKYLLLMANNIRNWEAFDSALAATSNHILKNQ